MKKSIKARIFYTVGGCCLFICLIATSGCSKGGYDQAVVTFTIGNTHLHRETEEPRTLRPMDKLQQNDIITTGANSEATFQLGETVVVKVLSNSSVTVASIYDSGKREIQMERGTVLTKAEKLLKGESFEMTSKTTVAGIRGTEFMMTTQPGISTVAVSEGKVAVRKIDSGEEKVIAPGERVVISDDLETAPMDDIDALILKKISVTPLIKNIDTPDKALLAQKDKEHQKNQNEINETLARTMPLPLKIIQAKYGRVDVVTLYSGQVIRGIILSRGDTVVMMTPATARLAIPKVKIKYTRIMSSR